jgi:hypothetical protein
VYASPDGGASWSLVIDGLPAVQCVKAYYIGDPAKARIPHVRSTRAAKKSGKAKAAGKKVAKPAAKTVSKSASNKSVKKATKKKATKKATKQAIKPRSKKKPAARSR